MSYIRSQGLLGSSAHTPVLPEGRDDRLIVVLEEKSVIGDCLIQLKGGGRERKKKKTVSILGVI